MAKQISLKKIVAALAVAGVAVGTAQAASITANASANVLTPISVAENVAMNFGDVAGDNDAATTVVLTSAGATSSADGAYANNGSGAAADFTVTGAALVAYTLSMPASISLTGPGTAMTIDTFSYSAGGAGARSIGAGGTENFTVGGTLHIGAAQTAGAYSGTYAVTVAY